MAVVGELQLPYFEIITQEIAYTWLLTATLHMTWADPWSTAAAPAQPIPIRPGAAPTLAELHKWTREDGRGAGAHSRKQVLLYLLALHDYDQSAQLNVLELLSMLTANKNFVFYYSILQK